MCVQETLSPLIFAVVADLFNMSIINHQDFVGHVINAKVSAKISARSEEHTSELQSRP